MEDTAGAVAPSLMLAVINPNIDVAYWWLTAATLPLWAWAVWWNVDATLNGVTAAALTIATGEVRVSALWALRFLPGESMQCVISSLGSLTEGDLAGVKLTMQFKAAPALLRVQD